MEEHVAIAKLVLSVEFLSWLALFLIGRRIKVGKKH